MSVIGEQEEDCSQKNVQHFYSSVGATDTVDAIDFSDTGVQMDTLDIILLMSRSLMLRILSKFLRMGEHRYGVKQDLREVIEMSPC